MLELSGKKAFITAAGQGIGRATAELFVEAGAHVIATDVNFETLSTLKGAQTHKLDVLGKDSIADCCDKFGSVDILFNCA